MTEPTASARQTPETADEADSTDEAKAPDRHPDYTEVTRSAYGTNSDARTAYREMQIKPSRVKRRSQLGKRFKRPAYYHYGSSVHCFQWDNGAGLMERTNRQSRGSASFRAQDGSSLPGIGADQLYRFLRSVDADLGLSDVVTTHRDDGSRNAAVEFESGDYLVILYDRSAAGRRNGSTRAGMFVGTDHPYHTQVARLLEREEFGNLSDLVAPDDVLADDRDVVDSNTYRKSSSQSRHDGDGGYGNEAVLGDVIIRQGEWYFIPMPEDWQPDGPVYKPRPNANRASDWDTSPIADEVPDELQLTGVDRQDDSLPEACPDCGAGGLEVNARLPLYACPACDLTAVYDDATFEEMVVSERDEWAKSQYGDLYDDATDALGSHSPRDLSAELTEGDEPDIFVRGTVRHNRNEHAMFNLYERWHRVVENTEDMYVFTRRSGGRWE